MKLSGTPVKGQAGFMLIEVLISVLIFSVGVLALVGLQSSMTRAQTESKVRADASYLAGELVGLMWTDPKNLAGFSDSSCASTPQCADWKAKVVQLLPTAVSSVVVTAATGRVSITLRWTLAGGTQHQYTTTTTVAINP
ncbi:MAG: pilus assembly protein PilV [Pseudomonadota bacterium]